jgi:hypothetical protein
MNTIPIKNASNAEAQFTVAMLRRARQGKATLEDVVLAAAELRVPLWALMIPGLDEHPELLVEGALEGLQSVVENYLASDPATREELKSVARAAANVPRRSRDARQGGAS